MQQVSERPVVVKKKDEKILTVPRQKIFELAKFDGFLPLANFDFYQALIELNKAFLWRSEVENDFSQKQIIPYLVFENNKKLFIMQRKSTASEARLQNKYSLGIGGHIRQEDIEESSLSEWAEREFEEEVDFKGTFEIKPIGLINDDSNDVGKVHFGIVFLLHGDSDKIAVRDEHKSGQLLSLDECEKNYLGMETWSQLVFDYLKVNKDF